MSQRPDSRRQIADAHDDFLLELVHRRAEAAPFARYWLPEFRAGDVGLQVAAIYAGLEHLPESGLRRALEQLLAVRRIFRENPDDVFLVRTRSELARSGGSRIGIVLAMEGAEPFGYDPDMCELFWALGVRLFALTWNRRNAFADGLAEPETGGLSRLGEQLVDRLRELGAIFDVTHASRRTFADVLERSGERPVIASHVGCRALIDTPRNLDDGQIAAIARRGGVVGIMAHPVAIDPTNPTLDRVVDHVLHAVAVGGADHVCIGADFIRQVTLSGAVPRLTGALLPQGMALEDPIVDYEGPADYPLLVERLAARGVDDDTLSRILWRNLLRVLGEGLPENAE